VSPFVVAECDYLLATKLRLDAPREFLDEVARDAFDSSTSTPVTWPQQAELSIGTGTCRSVCLTPRWSSSPRGIKTTRLLTLDERHFRAVAPLWGAPAFTLLPVDS
jgi:hypothetical protein